MKGQIKDQRALERLRDWRDSIVHKISIVRLINLDTTPARLHDSLQSHPSTRNLRRYANDDPPRLGRRLDSDATNELDLFLASVYRLGYHKLLIYPFGPSVHRVATPARLRDSPKDPSTRNLRRYANDDPPRLDRDATNELELFRGSRPPGHRAAALSYQRAAAAKVDEETHNLVTQLTNETTWYMREHGLTRTDLAVRMGVSPGRISQILGGEEPTLRTLAALAVALDSSFDAEVSSLNAMDTYTSRRGLAQEVQPSTRPVPGVSLNSEPGQVSSAEDEAYEDLADDGDGGIGNGGDATGNGKGDDDSGGRQVWPRLSCPDTVAAGIAFDLYVGLTGEEDTSVGGTGRFAVPAEEFDLGIEIEARGFAILRGPRIFTMRVTQDDPFPVRGLRLEPIADPDFRDRRIDVMFSVSGELRGYATRNVTVVATEEEAAAAQPRRQPDTDVKSARNVIALSRRRAPLADLTIIIRKDPKEPTTLSWSANSPHFEPSLTPESPRSDLGDPAAFLGEIVQQASGASDVEHGFRTLYGMGQTIAQKIPVEVRDMIRRVGDLCAPAAPTIQLATQDPYIPWELAVFEPPIGPAGGRSPFLGAQAAIGRWPLPAEPPPPREAPRSVAAHDRAVITVSYVGVLNAGQLPDAEEEEEAKCLLDAWPGARKVPAEFREVMDCLDGDPPADVLHFALHGKFDQSGRQEGIYLIGKHPNTEDQYRVVMLTPYDVKSASLGGRAPLVFLNACQVGASREVLGDYAGMALAFLHAGASAVIAPLWSIDDGAAKTYALSFYDSVSGADAMPPAEILRRERARLDRASVREDSPPPLDCMSYQFFGHPGYRLMQAVDREVV